MNALKINFLFSKGNYLLVLTRHIFFYLLSFTLRTDGTKYSSMDQVKLFLSSTNLTWSILEYYDPNVSQILD